MSEQKLYTKEQLIEIAETISFEQFEELCARVCIREAKAADEADVSAGAQWLFYSGMRDESAVAEHIQRIVAEEGRD